MSAHKGYIAPKYYMMYRSTNKYKTCFAWSTGHLLNIKLKDLVARSMRKCIYCMNGLKYDLKSNCIKKTDFFQIAENVMNFCGFK